MVYNMRIYKTYSTYKNFLRVQLMINTRSPSKLPEDKLNFLFIIQKKKNTKLYRTQKKIYIVDEGRSPLHTLPTTWNAFIHAYVITQYLHKISITILDKSTSAEVALPSFPHCKGGTLHFLWKK